MDTILQDLRYAARQLRSRPGFTLAVVLTLALGIGANTAMFSVVRAVLLRSLPYPDAGSLVVLWGAQPSSPRTLVAIPDVIDWRAQSRAFADIGVERSQSVNLTGGARPDRVVGAFVEARTLQILGARAELGRLFTDSETAIGSGQAVAVLSDAAWRSHFGADSGLVGRTLVLNGRPHVIIGVTVPGFRDALGSTDVWLPITSAPNPQWFQRGFPSVWAVARLKPGVTPEQAHADLSAVAANLARVYPATNGAYGISVVTIRDMAVGSVRPILVILFTFVGAVLLIACVNITNLQLTRAVSRRHEMSLRAALGAGQSRLARQLLTESVLLTVLGGAAGLLLAAWTIDAIVSAVPGGLPATGPVGLDPVVLLFAAGVTGLVGIATGVAPATHAARVSLSEALGTRGARADRIRLSLRNVFVGLQLALSIVLLAGAGLLGRTLLARLGVHPGFDTDHILTAEFRLPVAKYTTGAAQNAFMAGFLGRLRALPGVRSAALVAAVPLSGNWGQASYAPDDHPELLPASAPVTQQNSISDGAFGTLGVPLIAGRDFDVRDRGDAAQVAIVNETFARKVWPGQSAVGHRVKIFGTPDVWATVVGVVGDVKQLRLTDPPTPQLYQPYAQTPGVFNSILVRTVEDPAAFGNDLRSAVWAVDPEQPVWRVRPLESFVGDNLSGPRFVAVLTGAFSILALLLASLGLYGVTSFAVSQRTQEVGVRMALGARATQVVGMVLGRGLRIIGPSVLIGTSVAFAAARLLSTQLYGVSPADPVTFVGVPLLLVAVALLACYLPARRAARVDPVIALRAE